MFLHGGHHEENVKMHLNVSAEKPSFSLLSNDKMYFIETFRVLDLMILFFPRWSPGLSRYRN